MVWSCFSFFKLSKIVFVDGTLNSNSYQNILEEYLISFIDELEVKTYYFNKIMQGRTFLFQQKAGLKSVVLNAWTGRHTLLI
ncbi:hypothetical protein ENBRE01_2379 [Enteropsectra breve]|nr:hypothetical protein ENBRE01_2379 [Enteropsectra breve]